jgi:beta-glucosidase
MADLFKFPRDFNFGVADADLQVIGEKHCREEEESCETMWHHFALNSGKCHKNETPDEGVDRYHRYPEDVGIMQKMGIRHYRTSISMSRVLKQDGTVNAKAITWYQNYFKALNKAGIKIYATLYHWELPQYLNAQGGWTNPKIIDRFVAHARAVVKNLGEFIDEYFILNEPWCASMLSYHLGAHAPGETNLASALQAAHNLLLTQGLAFKEMKSISKDLKIGTAFNVETAYAASSNKDDVAAAQRSDGYFNRWFLDPLFVGKYPEDMLEWYGKSVPKINPKDMEIIKIGDKLSTLGINYYCGRIVKSSPDGDMKYAQAFNPNGLKNDLGWPVCIPPHYPEGFTDILEQVWFSYRNFGLKKIYITENGMAVRESDDTRRIKYYQAHLKQIYKTITRGVPVKAFFAWTLMDNYEWAEGYRPDSCFGMVNIDRKTLERTWKKSAFWYKNIVNSGRIMAKIHDILTK